jgi:all-trans-retinol dehydrogenase (NAD+)
MELAQLGKDGVKTTVVCPYYINTGMFEGAKSRFPRIIPFLEPTYVVDKIMEAVLTNQEILCLPRLVYVVLAFKNIIPAKASLLLNNFMGINHSMEEFKGRRAKNE